MFTSTHALHILGLAVIILAAWTIYESVYTGRVRPQFAAFVLAVLTPCFIAVIVQLPTVTN